MILAVLALVPIGVAGLWAMSGREGVTKGAKVIRVREQDELFGDVVERDVLTPGPIFGYFVGLDGVLVSLGGAALLAVGVLWFTRRRRSPHGGGGER